MTVTESKQAIANLIEIINNNLTDDIETAKRGVNELAGIEIYKVAEI